MEVVDFEEEVREAAEVEAAEVEAAEAEEEQDAKGAGAVGGGASDFSADELFTFKSTLLVSSGEGKDFDIALSFGCISSSDDMMVGEVRCSPDVVLPSLSETLWFSLVLLLAGVG